MKHCVLPGRWIVLLWAVSFCSLPLAAQKLDFERLSSELGLSQNMVKCILQDSKGFLWVGTKDGLNRFDGYRFTTFRYAPFDSLSISGNSIEHILEDRGGRFWVVTDNGINLFDREKEVFYSLKIIGSGNALVQDPQDNFWQGGSAKGLLRLSLPTTARTLENVKIDYINSGDTSGHIFTTPVWDASGRGFTGKFDREAYRLRFDSAQRTYKIDQNFDDVNNARFRNFLETTDSASNRFYNRFVRATEGKIWMSAGNELLCWDARTSQCPAITISGEFLNPENTPSKHWNYFTALVADRRGRAWLGGFAGTFLVDLNRKTLRCISPEPSELTDPLLYGVTSILEDQGGLIWIGTRGNGLLKYNDNARRFYPGLWRGQSIRALYTTTDGRVWLAPTSTQLYRLDPKTQKQVRVAGDVRFFGVDIGNVYAFHQDKSGALWLGSGNWGLVKMSGWQSGPPKIEVWRPETGLPHRGWYTPTAILESAAQTLWLVSPDALRRFDPRTGAFEKFPFFPDNDISRIERNTFPTLFQDRRGNIWVGTSEGLWRFDATQKTFKKFQNNRKNPGSLSHDLIKCIAEDPARPERFLWIGTGGGGLNRFDTETGTFEKFTEKDGLPDMVVYGILPDPAGNLWMSTNKGISVFNPANRTFRNFDQHDGLQNLEFNTQAHHKSADGQLFFGGIEGFNAFYPERMLHTNGHVPDIVFTDFKISNRSVSHKTPGSPLTTSIAYSRKIVLPTDVKIISFEFAALDFADPSKNQFACKMEGFDADWQYLGTTHSATYTNLAPGNYVFRVRGSNNDGVWNETGASIDIEILAPWWATWWAYILYGLVIGGILYTFYQLQAKRKQAGAEAGRLKDLNDAKSQFLSTVSHELRTPLTSIMGFSKIIRKRLEERILPNLDRSDPKTDRAAEQVVSNLGIVISESERLTALINDVLDLAKIESGKIVWHEERLDVSDLIERAAAATATLFEQKNIPLQLNIEPGLPDTLGDPDRLLQVLVNLLSNAVKFTDAGAVTCSARLQNAHTLLMAVADTGVGVPEEFRQMIFEKFRQVTGDTLTDKPQGTGLGLAISKEIVEHHGGRIWLESAPGKGSVFCFTLPVR